VLDDTPYMADIRAVVGARVSHVQGEEKTSHISQRGKGEAYAESQGWTVVGAFEDLDVSAIKLSPWDRPDLKVWLTDELKPGPFCLPKWARPRQPFLVSCHRVLPRGPQSSSETRDFILSVYVQVTSGSSVLRVPAQVSPCGCRSPAIPGTLHSR
jgi:hypothetical protein